jgi:hypothetical protein
MGTSSIEQGTKTTENLNRNIMAQLFTNAQWHLQNQKYTWVMNEATQLLYA